MKCLQILLVALATITFSTAAMADQASEVAAAKLLDSIGMERMQDHLIDVALDSQIAKTPELAPYRGVMRAFFTKYMSYAALKPQLVEAYASEFSAAELTDATAFYSTPTGRKLIAKLPTLMAKGADIGQHAVKDHIPELQQAVQEEARRIQAIQQKPSSTSMLAPDPYKVLPGNWGWEGTDDCKVSPQVLRFDEDGKQMHLSLAPHDKDGKRQPRRDATYQVIGPIANGLSMSLDGEDRLDALGKPVTWDLVLLGNDQYCWHRNDWAAGSCTKPVDRCEG